MTLIRGIRIDAYEIVAPIGRDGTGEVYRVKDHENERELTLKLLLDVDDDDPAQFEQFERQARSASELNHPNIVTVHDIGMHRETPYVVTEIIEGHPLKENLANGPLPRKLLLRFATQIADGLATAHSEGIVHGSLKPESLMVTDEGGIKILDFGLVNLDQKAAPILSQGEEGATNSTIATTKKYRSPEQTAGREVGPRSDQFAFGQILSDMATGAAPSHPEPGTKAVPNLPEDLRDIVDRCTEEDPQDRYVSTQSLCSDLKKLQRRPWIRLGVAALILAALALLLSFG